MKATQIFLLAFLVGTLAQAADRKGNGGIVIACRNQAEQIVSVELLDYYEARVLRNTVLSFGEEQPDVLSQIRSYLKPLKAIAPLRADYYLRQAEMFMSEETARFLDQVVLEPTKDSYHVGIPAGNCKIEQAAIQKERRFKGDKKYLVSNMLWQKMDNFTKAGLILHEIIYSEAIALGQEDSVNTRYFNSMLISQEFKTATSADLRALLTEVGMAKNLEDTAFPYNFLKVEMQSAVWCGSYVGHCQPVTVLEFCRDLSHTMKSSLMVDYLDTQYGRVFDGVNRPACVKKLSTGVFWEIAQISGAGFFLINAQGYWLEPTAPRAILSFMPGNRVEFIGGFQTKP